MCRKLAQRGLLLGGSSGTVLAGIRQMGKLIAPGACVVALSPDMGNRYVDTIYHDAWGAQHFPGLPLCPPAPAGARQLADTAC